MKSKILFVVCLLFGLLFIIQGANKFFNFMPVPDDLPEKLATMMTGLVQAVWVIPLIGAAEIIGGLLFIIPRYRALGALIILPVLVGIVLTTFYIGSGFLFTLILVIIMIWVIYENRAKYMALIR